MTDLSRALRKFNPGDTTTVTVYRNGQERYLNVVLDEKPQEEVVQQQPQVQPQEPGTMMPGEEGFEDWYNEFFRYFFGG